MSTNNDIIELDEDKFKKCLQLILKIEEKNIKKEIIVDLLDLFTKSSNDKYNFIQVKKNTFLSIMEMITEDTISYENIIKTINIATSLPKVTPSHCSNDNEQDESDSVTKKSDVIIQEHISEDDDLSYLDSDNESEPKSYLQATLKTNSNSSSFYKKKKYTVYNREDYGELISSHLHTKKKIIICAFDTNVCSKLNCENIHGINNDVFCMNYIVEKTNTGNNRPYYNYICNHYNKTKSCKGIIVRYNCRHGDKCTLLWIQNLEQISDEDNLIKKNPVCKYAHYREDKDMQERSPSCESEET